MRHISHSRPRQFACVAILFGIGAAYTQTTPTESNTPAAPGSKTGSAIGTAISTAISVAFPALSKVLSAIWPQGQDTKKKTKSDAVTSTQPLQQQANDGLKSITSVAVALDTVTTFLSNCVIAEDNVVGLRGYLLGKSVPLSPDDKLRVARYWNEVSGHISKLANAGTSLNGLGDPDVQGKFRDVSDANNGLIATIKAELDSSAPSALSAADQDLGKLDGQLAAVNAISAEIIGDISFGFKNAKNTAAGAQGGTQLTDAQSSERAALNAVLVKYYPAASHPR